MTGAQTTLQIVITPARYHLINTQAVFTLPGTDKKSWS